MGIESYIVFLILVIPCLTVFGGIFYTMGHWAGEKSVWVDVCLSGYAKWELNHSGKPMPKWIVPPAKQKPESDTEAE